MHPRMKKAMLSMKVVPSQKPVRRGVAYSDSFAPMQPLALPPSTYCPNMAKNITRNMLHTAAKPKPFRLSPSTDEAVTIAMIPITSEMTEMKFHDISRTCGHAAASAAERVERVTMGAAVHAPRTAAACFVANGFGYIGDDEQCG